MSLPLGCVIHESTFIYTAVDPIPRSVRIRHTSSSAMQFPGPLSVCRWLRPPARPATGRPSDDCMTGIYIHGDATRRDATRSRAGDDCVTFYRHDLN